MNVLKGSAATVSAPDRERKTLRLMACLTKNETEQIRVFATMYLFDQDTRSIFEGLLDLYPDFQATRVTARLEKVGKGLNRKLSQINEVLEIYFAFRGLQRDEIQQQRYLVARLTDSPDEDLFHNVANQAGKLIHSEPMGLENMFQYYMLHREIGQHWNEYQHDLHSSGIYNEFWSRQIFIETINTLNLCTEISEQRLYQRLKNEAKQAPALLLMAEKMLELIRSGPNLPALDEAILFFQRNHTQIADNEKDIIFRLLFNLCMHHMQAGDTDFSKRFLELCEWALQGGILHQRWFKSEEDMVNLLLIVLKFNTEEEFQRFLDNNLHLLPPKLAENVHTLIKAYLAYRKKDFQETLFLLQQLKISKIALGIRVYVLQVRAQYEYMKSNHDFETTLRTLNNYRRYFSQKNFLNQERRAQFLQLHTYLFSMTKRRQAAKRNRLKINFSDLLQQLQSAETPRPQWFSWLENELKNP